MISIRKTLVLLSLLVSALYAGPSAGEQGLHGSWQLVAYDRYGDLDVSGLMVMADGRFAFVFDMALEGKSMRGHGGTYEVEGDRLVYSVPWWVERVAGKAQVMAEERKAPGRIERDGDFLTMNFDAGTVQKYKKNPSVAADGLTGAWLMEGYEGGAKTGPTTGILVFADRNFALVYTMKPAGDPEGRKDGRAHAGPYEKDGESLKLTLNWSLHVVGGETTIEEPGGVHALNVKVTGDTLRLGFGEGASMTFRRAE